MTYSSKKLLGISLHIDSDGKIVLERETIDMPKLKEVLSSHEKVDVDTIMPALHDIDKQFHDCENYITTRFGVEDE